MIDTVLFDLDGTLLPMDLDAFIKAYMGELNKKLTSLGFDSKKSLDAVLAGTKAMYKTNGETLNYDTFWNTFEQVSGIKREECESDLEDFYKNDFVKLGSKVCLAEKCDNMIKAVHILKEKGYKLVLATNPLFPKLATQARIKWAHLDEELFELVTSYENCHFTKPNIKYYEEVLDMLSLKAENCMMVGNDSLEDGMIEKLGIPLYLVKDYLIHREDTPLSSKWQGSSEEFLNFVKAMPKVK